MAADVEKKSVEAGENFSRTPIIFFRKIEIICKTIAWFIIIISAAVHFYRLFQFEYAGQTCPLLFESGHWVGDIWQPDGCMLHEYIQSEIKTCLQNQRVALVGDSRMRSLYFQFANSVSEEPVPTGYHEDLKYEDKSNTSIKFYWLPELDSNVNLLLQKWIQNPSIMPNLIIMGVATWKIKMGQLAAIVDYQEQLKILLESIAFISQNLTFYNEENAPLSRFHHEPQLIWMMQDPVVESKLDKRRKTITNDKIEAYNYAAEKSLQSSSPFTRLMKATTLMAAGKPDETNDGLHYSSFIIEKKVNAILNAFCNDYIYPDDATCCKDLEKITQLQFNAFAVFATCLLLWIIMMVCRKIRDHNIKGLNDDEIERLDSLSALPWLYTDHMYASMKAMAKLAAIMLYVFLADSSLLYNKDHKRYSHAAFFIPLGIMFVIGLFTRAPVKQATVLNSDQVEEWKGWMIIILMLYNYTHAQQVLPIFVNARLIVSSFLFMVGFVHFRRFWYTADFGLYKICKVMAHLNVFCVVLCLVMGHPYQFYYIVPLLSFWFFVVYASMAFIPRITHDVVTANPKTNYWMVGKLIVLFAVTFVVWAYENVCEWVFSQKVMRELFIDSNGQIHEWRINSGLHRYSVLFGMICSYVYVTLKRNAMITDEDSHAVLIKCKKTASVVIVLAFIGLLGYEVQAFTCHSKSLCDHTHPVASCLPVLSYVLLRNIPGWLRSKYSVFFAWVGNMSLELFIGQYHIWLSNDTHGIHVLIPGNITINALVTTFTFVCVIHEVKKICTVLAEALITKDVRIMLRRLVFFIMMLIVIWWHKTHERKPTLY